MILLLSCGLRVEANEILAYGVDESGIFIRTSDGFRYRTNQDVIDKLDRLLIAIPLKEAVR